MCSFDRARRAAWRGESGMKRDRSAMGCWTADRGRRSFIRQLVELSKLREGMSLPTFEILSSSCPTAPAAPPGPLAGALFGVCGTDASLLARTVWSICVSEPYFVVVGWPLCLNDARVCSVVQVVESQGSTNSARGVKTKLTSQAANAEGLGHALSQGRRLPRPTQ